MKRTRTGRVLRWLTVAGIIVAIVSTLSYATGAHMALRFIAPRAGAWWNGQEFWFMEGACTGVGILVGIRLAMLAVENAAVRARAAILALVVCALLIVPLTHLCALAARPGFSGAGAALESRMVGMFGFGRGSVLDKILIAGVYSLKTAGFGLLIGLALSALALVVFLAVAPAQTSVDPASLT